MSHKLNAFNEPSASNGPIWTALEKNKTLSEAQDWYDAESTYNAGFVFPINT